MSDSDPAEVEVTGTYFSPGSSKTTEAVLVVFADDRFQLMDAVGATVATGHLTDLAISPRVGSIPRRLTFADGSVFETPDNDLVDAFAARLQPRAHLVHLIERFRVHLFVVVFATVVLAVGIYRYAIPVMVNVAVWATPPVVAELLSDGAMETLDRAFFGHTKLGADEQQAIRDEFETLAALSDEGVEGVDLHFRAGLSIGPNAFALPDGTIILTDELIDLADGDMDMILGVLAHEIAHVELDHSLRSIYRSVGIAVLIMFIGGDIGAAAEDVLAQGSILLTLANSRRFEFDADRRSVELMLALGRDPLAVAGLFRLLQAEFGVANGAGFLSTHPATGDRITEIEAYAAEIAAP